MILLKYRALSIFSLSCLSLKKKNAVLSINILTVASAASSYGHNSLFWFYKSLCSFKFPVHNFSSSKFLTNLTNFYIKKNKNYLKFSALNIEKVSNFQWNSIYVKAILFNTSMLPFNHKSKMSLFSFLLVSLSSLILFNFYIIKCPAIFSKNVSNFSNYRACSLNLSFYKNNYKNFSIKKKNNYKQSGSVELTYFKIKLFRLKKFKGISLSANLKTNQEPTPCNTLLNKFLINFLKDKNLNLYFAHIRNKSFILYDLFSRTFYDSKGMQTHLKNIMSRVKLYEKFFFYKKKEMLLLKQNELLILNNRRNNYIDWKTKQFSISHLIFFNKVRLTYKKKISHLTGDSIFLNLDFLDLFKDKNINFCYLPNNIKVKKLFYNKKFKKFIYFRRIRHFIQYIQNINVSLDNNYVYQIWKKASELKNLTNIWLKFRKKNVKWLYSKNKPLPVVNTYDNDILEYFNRLNAKHCYIPKGITFNDIYAYMPSFLVNSPKTNVVCLLRSKLLRLKKNYRFERWYPSDELQKSFLIAKKSCADSLKCKLLGKLKLFMLTSHNSSFSNNSLVVNPFLLELYAEEDPYHCFIPESITIFHILTSMRSIRHWYYSTPSALFRNILIYRQNSKSQGVLKKINNSLLTYHKIKIPSLFSKWEPRHLVFNNNFFSYVTNNSNVADLSGLSIDMIFLDGFSRNFFKNYNLKILVKVILSKNYYVYVRYHDYTPKRHNANIFVANEILTNLKRLNPLKLTKSTKPAIKKSHVKSIPKTVLKNLRPNIPFKKLNRPLSLKKLKFSKLKLLRVRKDLIINRLSFYKMLSDRIESCPITFKDISYFYKKKFLRKRLMFNLHLQLSSTKYSLRLKKKQQRFTFLNLKFSSICMSAFVKNFFSNTSSNSYLIRKLFSFNKVMSTDTVKNFLRSFYSNVTNFFSFSVLSNKPLLKKFKSLLSFLYINLFKNHCKTSKLSIKKITKFFNSTIKNKIKTYFKIKSSTVLSNTFFNNLNFSHLGELASLRIGYSHALKKKSKLLHLLTKKQKNFKLLAFFSNNKKNKKHIKNRSNSLRKRLLSLKKTSFDVYFKFKSKPKVLREVCAVKYPNNVILKKKFKKLLGLISSRNVVCAYIICKDYSPVCLPLNNPITLYPSNRRPVSSVFSLALYTSHASSFVLINFSTYKHTHFVFTNKINLLGTCLFVSKLYVNFNINQLKKLHSWVFALSYLIKPGFLNYISKLSSFLNSLFFFIKKQRLSHFFNKFWVDRGFFFPIELSLFKFFFLYYTNFFFNFFEISTFLNFNSFYKKNQICNKSLSRNLLLTGNTIQKKVNSALLFKSTIPTLVKFNLKSSYSASLSKSHFMSVLNNFFNKSKKSYKALHDTSLFFNFLAINKKVWYRKFFRKTRVMLKNFNFSNLSNLTNCFYFSKDLIFNFFNVKKKSFKNINLNFFNVTHDFVNLNFFTFYKTFNFFKNYLTQVSHLVTLKNNNVKSSNSFLFNRVKSLKKMFTPHLRLPPVLNLISFKFLYLKKKTLLFKKRLWKSFKKKNTIFFKNKRISKKRSFFKKTLSFFDTKSLYKSKFLLNKNLTSFFSNNHLKSDKHAIFNFSKLLSKQHLPKTSVQSFFLKNKIKHDNSPSSFIENYFSKPQSVSIGKGASRTNYVVKKKNIIFKIKPGYKVLWRQYRQEYKLITNLSFYRQRRLTNYFLNFKKSNGVAFLKNFEFSVFSILRRSTVFLDYTVSSVCFSLGMVFLNGQKMFNKLFQVYVGDRLQVILSYNYLLQFKWFFFFVNLRKIRFLTKYVKHFFNISGSSLILKKRLLQFSEKLFKKLLYLGNDVPNYLEVDFMTMLVVVIYDPFLFCEFDPILIFRVPFLSLRLYNWKYIN